MLLDNKIIEEFDKLLSEGASIVTACDIIGISNKTYYNWKNKAEEISEAKDQKEELFLHFLHVIKKARAEFKHKTLKVINRASIDSWQAAAWLLERMYPEEFGRVGLDYRDHKDNSIETVDFEFTVIK